MQEYDTHDDMNKKEYRPAKDESSTQVAWTLIRNPRPLVHELGSISLKTVRKILYKLYVHNHEAPEGFIFGRDVLLLSIIIGEDGHRKTKPFIEMLKSLDVFEGAGAYYVVIDTSLNRPLLHVGAYLEVGLDTALTIAALVREQASLADEYKVYEWGHDKQLDKERYEFLKKQLDEDWALVLAMIENQGFVDDSNFEDLTDLVADTLELARLSNEAEMLEVWAARTNERYAVQDRQLRQNPRQLVW